MHGELDLIPLMQTKRLAYLARDRDQVLLPELSATDHLPQRPRVLLIVGHRPVSHFPSGHLLTPSSPAVAEIPTGRNSFHNGVASGTIGQSGTLCYISDATSGLAEVG
jgi:hypothetical protein